MNIDLESKCIITAKHSNACNPTKSSDRSSRCIHIKGIDVYQLDFNELDLNLNFGSNVVNFFIVDSGSGYFQKGKKIKIFETGDVIFYKPLESYEICYENDTRVRVFTFCLDYFTGFDFHGFSKIEGSSFECQTIKRIIDSISDMLFFHFENFDYQKTRILIDGFVNCFFSLVGVFDYGEEKFDCLNKIKNKIINVIDDPYLDIKKICEISNVSAKTLNRIFSIESTTAMKWVVNTRLERSYRKIINDFNSSVSTIAYESGFKDSSHFSRTFKKRFGVSPANLRKLNLEKNDS